MRHLASVWRLLPAHQNGREAMLQYLLPQQPIARYRIQENFQSSHQGV